MAGVAGAVRARKGWLWQRLWIMSKYATGREVG
jgi:hypothetical protein